MFEIGDFPQSTPMGWICPKCGRVYSPFTPVCFYCPTKIKITASSTIGET